MLHDLAPKWLLGNGLHGGITHRGAKGVRVVVSADRPAPGQRGADRHTWSRSAREWLAWLCRFAGSGAEIQLRPGYYL